MTRDEVEMLLLQIHELWKSVEVNDISLRVWQRQLADVTLEQAERALDAYSRGAHAGQNYPPKPFDLRDIIVLAYLTLPTEDDAWRMVVAEANRSGYGRTYFHDGERYRIEPSIPIPEVALAAESIGWRHICNTCGDFNAKEYGFTQRDFRASYNRYVSRTRQAAALMAPDALADWRWQQAASVKTVKLQPPQSLYELGAPDAYAALVDGSGPDAPRIQQSLTPMLPATTGWQVSPARRDIINARIGGLAKAMTGQAIPKSALAARKVDRHDREND